MVVLGVWVSMCTVGVKWPGWPLRSSRAPEKLKVTSMERIWDQRSAPPWALMMAAMKSAVLGKVSCGGVERGFEEAVPCSHLMHCVLSCKVWLFFLVAADLDVNGWQKQ